MEVVSGMMCLRYCPLDRKQLVLLVFLGTFDLLFNMAEPSIVVVVIMNDQVNLHMINVQIILVTGKGLVR